jgi:hypothetical protein
MLSSGILPQVFYHGDGRTLAAARFDFHVIHQRLDDKNA